MLHHRRRIRPPANSRSQAPRFVLYSHDGFGLGHLRRNTVLASAIVEADPTASVLLACSAEGLESFTLPDGVDVLRLPGLRKIDNGHYAGRRLRLDTRRLLGLRASLLRSAVEQFRPHVLLADKHPLGIGGELLPALELLSRRGGRAALGLRDVLDDGDQAASEWLGDGVGNEIARLYHRLLVYGSPDVLSPITPALVPSEVLPRVRYSGYVVSSDVDRHAGSGRGPVGGPSAPRRRWPADPRHVLATVGGGEDGMPILDAFLDAARGASWQGTIVAGPQMDAGGWAALEQRARAAGVVALRAVPHLARWFSDVPVIVCMGGYNTLVEAVASGTAAVCVPRTRPRREQLVRARAFAERGLISVVEPDELTGQRLAQAIADALAAEGDGRADARRATLDLGGRTRAAALLLELASEVTRPVGRHRARRAAHEPRNVLGGAA